MAHDPELADRVRASLSGAGVIDEKTMFGGLAFMVDGRLAVSVGAADLLVRVPRERDAEYLRRPGVRRPVMGSRSMGEGWVTVDRAHLDADEDLRFWVDASLGRS